MSTHKHIDKICLVGSILSLILMFVFLNGEALGIQAVAKVMGYEQRLFDTSRVHTIDIVMDDWAGFLETCRNEEYAVCSVVIDGEAYQNVGIRAKGNTSLSMVSASDSDRYSFKIEFDQYDSTKSYHGLDKLSLNNLIQDNTMMKDYLTYQMMGQFGAAAPLCSYVYITVNGEDWGLYLAVEGVEEAFLQRNYGNDYGELYKPDSMNMGGGRGNGRNFNMEEFMNERAAALPESNGEESSASNTAGSRPGDFDPAVLFGESTRPGGFDPSALFGEGALPENFTPPAMPGQNGDRPAGFGGGFGGMGGGMGFSDTKLQYIDDDPDSYSAIFNSAKTDITEADKTRLIQSLKTLSERERIEDAVAVEDVIRYFVVHNFVVNGDSYTGGMIHNYYLYEEEGRLSMLPWDYNLAFGCFQSSSATDAVNDPIDTPLSVTGNGDRPIIDWILSSEEYTQLYHEYFMEFLESTDFAVLIDETAELIAPYVEKDPGRFCTYEEFKAGVAALREFCLLRAESVRGQLDGTIPANSERQRTDDSSLIDASHITISDMGGMNMGRGGFQGGGAFQNRDGASDGRGRPGEMPQTIETYESAVQRVPNLSEQPAAAPDNAETDNGQFPFPGGMRPLPNTDGQTSENVGRGFPAGAFPNGEDVSQAPSSSRTWRLMGVSVLVLLIGLVVVSKFKR